MGHRVAMMEEGGADTFGLVVLEAFASGCSAVVSSQGGPKDTVQHSRTGYIARNPEEFIAFTELLLARSDLLRPMALAARSYALSTSWERTFEAIYNTAVYNTYEECFYRPRSSLDLSIAKEPPSFFAGKKFGWKTYHAGNGER
jgi:glycosyltransferase involved in cell wall biosynthesis